MPGADEVERQIREAERVRRLAEQVPRESEAERVFREAERVRKLMEPIPSETEAEKIFREAETLRKLSGETEVERIHRQMEETRRVMPPNPLAPILAATREAASSLTIPIRLPDGHLASGFCERLVAWIQEFEERLDADHEVGVRLVAFGQALVFHLSSMTFWNPALIRFDGVDDAGNPVQLIQHVTQISVLLLKLPKQGEEKRRVGFFTSTDDTEVHEEAQT